MTGIRLPSTRLPTVSRSSSTRLPLASAPVVPNDTTPPVFTNLLVTGATTTSFEVDITTDEAATVVIEVVDDTNFQATGYATASSFAMVDTTPMQHVRVVSGRTPSTLYRIRAQATDVHGNVSPWTSTTAQTLVASTGGWGDSGTPSGFTLAPLRLGATFESLDVEQLFTEGSTTIVSATVQYRESIGPGATKNAWPLWLTRMLVTSAFDRAGAAGYGSCLFLTQGTSYEVKVEITDSNGLIYTRAGSVTMRSESEIVDRATLLTLVNRYVDRVTGNDNNDGLTAGTAWATVRKAVTTAPSGSVVMVKKGYYTVSGQKRSTALGAITFVGEFDAVDIARNEINAGNHTVFEYGKSTTASVNDACVSGPSGATDVPAGQTNVWQLIPVVGPNSGTTYHIYQWIGAPCSSPTQMGYGATRADHPERITHVTMVSTWTDARRVEYLFENESYKYGFFYGQTSSTLYLRVPPTAPSSDPNTMYIQIGLGNGIELDAPNCRIRGIEVRNFGVGIKVSVNARRCIFDYGLYRGSKYSIAPYATKPTAAVDAAYGSDHVVQYNRFEDANLRAQTGGSIVGLIPWFFIKTASCDDPWGHVSQPGADSQSTAVWGSGGARRVVIRHNTVDGYFNAFGAQGSGFDRYAGSCMDVHDNFVTRVADDFAETEPFGMNWRIWNNRVEHTMAWVSLARAMYGPVFIYRNVGWRMGYHDTNPGDNGYDVAGGFVFKVGYNNLVGAEPIVYVINNTVWTDSATSVKGAAVSNAGTLPPTFYIRNFILRLTQRIASWNSNLGSKWNEDYNSWATTSATLGLQISSSEYRTIADVLSYRSVIFGGAAHTNLHSGSTIAFTDTAAIDACLTDPVNGDLTLKAGTNPLVGSGTTTPFDPSGAVDRGYAQRAA